MSLEKELMKKLNSLSEHEMEERLNGVASTGFNGVFKQKMEVSLDMDEFNKLILDDLKSQFSSGFYSEEECEALYKVIKMYSTKEEWEEFSGEAY